MGFILYSAKEQNVYQETAFNDLQNKGFWCSITEDKERAFVEVTKKMRKFHWKVGIHPEKAQNLMWIYDFRPRL